MPSPEYIDEAKTMAKRTFYNLLKFSNNELQYLPKIFTLEISEIQATAEFVNLYLMRAELAAGFYLEFDPSELFFVIKDANGQLVGSGEFSHFLNASPE